MITSTLPRTVAQDAAGSHTIRPGPETVARLPPQLSKPPVVSGISPVEVNRALALPDANATDQERLVFQHNILTNKIQALLSQQPHFKSFMDEHLGQAFGLRPPLNTDSVYFHRYRTDADGQRTQESCERLSEMLFKTIQALKAEPHSAAMQRRDDAGEIESGFYPSAAAADSDKKLDTFTPLRSLARRIETQLPQNLGHFWSASSRQDELLDLHRALLSTQAALRVQDGTLSPAGKQLIDQAFQHPTLAQREQVIADGQRAGVYPITLNDGSPTPALLAGAFMLTRSDGSSAARPFQPDADRSLAADAQHGPVVLYTPGEGFEEFATPAEVLDTLRRRISTDGDAADVLMQSLPLSTQANLEADWGKHLSPRFSPLAADVVAAGLQQLLERQQQQTHAALHDLFNPQMPVVSADPLRRPQTLQALHKASDLAPQFDGSHAMAVRAEKLLHLLQSESTQAGTASVVAQDKPLKTALADNHNLDNLARQLQAVAKDLAQDAGPEAVSQALKTTHMDVHPDASPTSSTSAAVPSTVSLEAFVSASGVHLPTTKNQVVYLADAVAMRAAQHPFGDFGGGLSWPIPLSTAHQREIGSFLESNRTGLPGFPAAEPGTGALGYLLGGTTLSASELQNPAKAIEKLVTSARGQALGAAIQARVGGIPSNNSVNDYVLTAINVGLDQASIDSPRRNRVAGMDLCEPRHWGKSAASLVNELGRHLVNSGKASAASAPLASHLLLARVAPQFLVKDIPPTVVYGSQAWANFSIAVAKIEADAPAATTSMTFAQVMKAFNESGVGAPPSAQKAALLDWAVAQAIVVKKEDDSYSPAEIEHARTAFNQQQNERMTASGLLNSQIPNRRDIALTRLKQEFGDQLPFEEKLLQLDDDSTAFAEPLYHPNRLPAGRHSMLDIAMMELRNVKWKTTDPRVPLAAINAPLELGVNQVFNQQFDHAIASRKKGIATTVRHMIAQLPLADRQNFEHGKLEFFQEKTYRLGLDFTSRTLHEKNSRLLVKASGTGAVVLYGIDLKKGSIETVALSELSKTRERNANKQAVVEPFTAASVDATEFDPKPGGSPAPLPASFSSARSQAIADAFVEHLEVDSAEVVKQARGASSLDLQKEHEWKVADFFLNLIPLRSAIVNFRDGNYADGVMDLAMDVFGFLTAGAGVAAKVAKVGATATTAANRALQTAKIIGVATIGAFNPTGGVGDLLVGAGRLAVGGAKVTARALNSAGNAGLALVTEGIARTRGVSAGYNLLEASRHYGAAAKGTFKVADQSLEGAAIVHKGKWHAYDPVKKTAYGPPRDDFNPLNTLMPPSPNINTSRISRPAESHGRFNPIDTSARPARIRKPLPEGEYATSMKGKLEADHFKSETKATTFAKFLQEMNDHYAAVKAGNVPPRPSIPDIPKPLSVSDLIVETLKVSDGAVFGEAHNQMASFKVLYENAETLRAQGVKKVYFEGMIDNLMGLTDDGIGMLGKTRQPRTSPTLDQLMRKLEANGMEIVPLDHYYLTRHKDVRNLLGPTSTGFGSVRRLEEFNYYAAQTIKATSNGDKWVALVGNAHMKTCEGVPGLAELTGSIGVGVFNRTDGQASVGMRSTRHVPDPAKPLQANDWPGDLHIFKRV